MLKTHLWNVIFSFLLWSYAGMAQSRQLPGTAFPNAEKVYLQLPSTTYVTGQTIWFKAVVTDAIDHLPSALSGVLYVELINPKGHQIEHNLVRINRGIGHGHIELQKNLDAGSYLLRAYTQWNRNFGDAFMYTSLIDVLDPADQPPEKEVVKEQTTSIPSLASPIADIAVPKVYFMPESGKLIQGFRNKIGFKALAPDGKGLSISGEIIDNRGNRISAFKSNHLGMGFFYLKPDSKTNYRAKIYFTDKNYPITTVALPQVVNNGSILAVERASDKIRLRILTNTLKDRVGIKVSCREKDYFLLEGQISNSGLVTEIPARDLPEGIIVFTLLDKKDDPVAERLYFNTVQTKRLRLRLETDKTEYRQREQTQISIKIRDSIAQKPVTNFSVLVINKAQWPGEAGQHILSYFLLESELRGTVEEPGYYFKKENISRFNDLDALMLTQGWRNYKFPVKRQSNTYYIPEGGLGISGSVRYNTPKKKPVAHLNLALAAFGETPTYYQDQTDSLGRFKFYLDNIYSKKIRLLLQGNEIGVRKKNVNFTLETRTVPKIELITKVPIAQQPGGVALATIKAQQRRNTAQAAFDSLTGVTQLEEVVVKAYKLTPARMKAYKDFGAPDFVIRGDTLQRQEKEWSYGLYSILLFNYPDQVRIERFPDGFMLALVNNGHTLVAIDGQLIRDFEYLDVQHLSPQLIESVEIMAFVPAFKKKFLNVFPGADPYTAPAIGHVISVFTKNRVGLNSSGKPISGMLNTTIEGFAPIKEFYAPEYDVAVKPEEDKPDLRSLIHWAPSVLTDEEGKASVSFYNGDIPGDYVVIVEAISENGQIGYSTMEYQVREKAQ